MSIWWIRLAAYLDHEGFWDISGQQKTLNLKQCNIYIYSGRGSSCNIVEQLATRASDTGKKHQTYVDMRNLKDLSESCGQCKTKIGSHGFLPPHFLRWPPSNMETFNLEKASITQNSQIWRPNTELRLLDPSWWNFEVWVWKEKTGWKSEEGKEGSKVYSWSCIRGTFGWYISVKIGNFDLVQNNVGFLMKHIKCQI